MKRSFRLIDAVAVAAAFLLLLKMALYLTSEDPLKAVANIQNGQASLPGFAHVLAYARSNTINIDVKTTGAVPAGDEKKADDKKADEKKADDRKADGAGAKTSEKNVEPERPKDVLPATPGSASEKALLERLNERREEIQGRNRDIELRERLLEDAEQKLEKRINELRTMEEKAQDNAAKKGETETTALKNLVLMYETMKPKDAAKVFDRLSLEVLVPVVLQMNPRKMSEVLAAMTPETAEKLTIALANRARGLPDPRAAQPAAQPVMSPNELPLLDDPNMRPRR